MIQSFSDYLQARNQQFSESERIQHLELAVWANPRVGPEAREKADATIKTMKANLETLTNVITDYEAEQIVEQLTQRRQVRMETLRAAGLSRAADSDGGDEPRVVRVTRPSVSGDAGPT